MMICEHSLSRRLMTFALVLCSCTCASAQQPTPKPAIDPKLTPQQAQMIEVLAGFYRRVGANVPGGKESMADRLRNWSREILTVPIAIGPGRDLLGSEGRGRMPPEKIMYEMRRFTHIYFCPFTKAGDADTNAEYNPETGLVAVNETLAGRLVPDDKILPNGESAVRHLILRLECAQTFVHEMIHTGQGADAGSPANEAIAYREALRTTHDWLAGFERDYATARTKENARYTWAAAVVWLGYLNTIRYEIIPKGTATADALPAAEEESRNAEIARVTALQDRLMQEHRAIEILEQMAGPSVIPGTVRTLDELLVGLTAHDLQELEQRVRRAARDAFDQGAGDLIGRPDQYDAAGKAFHSGALADGALPLLRDAWRRRLQAAAQSAQKVAAFQPVIRFRPETGSIDPQTKVAKLVVDVENDAEFARLVDDLGRRLQTATGDPAKLTVVDTWSATDLEATRQVWRSGLTKTFEFNKEQDYEIRLLRTVFTRVEAASPRIDKKIEISSFDVFFVEPPKTPTAAELAGVWTGSLVISAMPMLDAVGPGQPPSANEGCQFPGIDLSQLRRLQGKPMKLHVDIRPQSETTGLLTLTVTPPPGFAAPDESAAPEPQRLPYRYENGSLQIDVAPAQGAEMVMQAVFAGDEKLWKFRGTWSIFDNSKSPKVKALSGEWSGSKAR